MFSRTRTMLAELEATVDTLRGREWHPSDAVLADTIYTLGDAIAEVDRILLDLHKELVRRRSKTPTNPADPTPAVGVGVQRTRRATSPAQ